MKQLFNTSFLEGRRNSVSGNMFANSAGACGDSADAASADAAFEARALAFMNRLYRTALRLTGCPRFAKNLLYDTYLKARHGHDRFPRNDDLGLWMFRILFEALRSNHKGAELQHGGSLGPGQIGGPSLDLLLAHSAVNTSPYHPFREMPLPPLCA